MSSTQADSTVFFFFFCPESGLLSCSTSSFSVGSTSGLDIPTPTMYQMVCSHHFIGFS